MCSTVRDLAELTPTAKEACALFLAACGARGLAVCITETYRSQERQDFLYAQGRTRAGKVVTWTKKSRHTSRRAWDICKNEKGKEYSDTEFFKRCGAVARELGITWGGDWKTPDMPHFEVNADWVKPKEEEEMSEAERKKFNALVEVVESLTKRVDKLSGNMIYNYIDENMPEWARATVEKLVNKGLLTGDGNGLHLTDSDLKQFVVNDRAGLYD